MRINDFIHSFQSEWLKKKRSLGSWLIVVGSLFTPVIIIAARLAHHDKLPRLYASGTFWTSLWRSSWESMAIFFMPMAAILATSLITQIEFRNNAWKQVHTLPLSPATLFFSKLAVILVLMVQFFVLFDLGIYLSAVVPFLLLRNVPYPSAPLPLRSFLIDTGRYMIACLPIVAAQYLLSLRFKNFLVPVGMGFMTWVGALAALSWKFGYIVPYAYSMLTYLKDDPKGRTAVPAFQMHWLAIGYALLFTIGGYWLFVNKRQKG
jgi:hypothetical protein